MVMPLSPSEIRFVDEYMRLGKADAAVQVSQVRYEKQPTDMRSPHVIASEMLSRKDIQDEIAGRGLVESPVVRLDKDTLVMDAYEIKERALSQDRFSEAINALKLVGDFEGLRVQKVEVTTKRSLGDMTDDELMALLEGNNKVKVIGNGDN